ncbi:DUF1146 domain-containing protein [Peribacillus saganii]|uniref:DUF1146 domain-containing protein n=1 Tax=Peribacillus saganii TaxID=2303992 RepID=A0A372L9L7_9BACI|nr:DUF1146 family protein [Peribacillus saganii]RFU62195.1 DUF1146 domain-containing protein [Peribacillus saganii]
MFSGIGQQALTGIIVHLLFIALTWWALQALHFDKLLKTRAVMQARLLYILLTIAIGSSVSNFFLDYLLWSNQLPYIYKNE